MPKATNNYTAAVVGRRALARGGVGLAALVGVGAAATATPVSSDADLIRLCDEYVRALAVYERDGGHVECDCDPLWHAVEALERELDGLDVRTMEGVVAKARVALYNAQQPDGSEDFSTSYTGHWPEEIIRDLLRLHGEV